MFDSDVDQTRKTLRAPWAPCGLPIALCGGRLIKCVVGPDELLQTSPLPSEGTLRRALYES